MTHREDVHNNSVLYLLQQGRCKSLHTPFPDSAADSEEKQQENQYENQRSSEYYGNQRFREKFSV